MKKKILIVAANYYVDISDGLLSNAKRVLQVPFDLISVPGVFEIPVTIAKNIKKYDVFIGMYHDQVLTPIKTIMGFKAINITLGLPFIRVSPDHGVAADIVGKKVADPSSLIESIKLFNNIQ